MTIKIGYNEAARARIRKSVEYTEGVTHGASVPPHTHDWVMPYPLDLFEIKTAWEVDEDTKCYKTTAYPCFMEWCTVDGDGHYSAPCGEYDTGAKRRWRKRTTDDAVDIYAFAGPVDSNQEFTAPPACGIGSRVWVTMKYDKRVLYMDVVDVPFELKADKTPGTEAAAYPIKSDGTADTEAETFDVYDQEGGKQWRALGSDTTGSDGARGFARMGSSGNLEIVSMLEQAMRVKGTVTAAVSEGDSTFYISSASATDGGQMPGLDQDNELEITNDGYKICSGATVKCELDVSDGTYHPYDAPPCC
jgi:hypothetical protein